MDFPERLATLRKKKGMTQQVLTDAIELHISQLKRNEADSSQPTLDVLRKEGVGQLNFHAVFEGQARAFIHRLQLGSDITTSSKRDGSNAVTLKKHVSDAVCE